MYRVQLTGNNYILNKQVGLHYQLHRGIGVHQLKANLRGKPLKVSVFVGGPPSHTVAAVMPLPEGMGEAAFAGVLGGRRFRYTYIDGYCISTDADFVITGEVHPGENMPEGPFGDHLGYYSLQHLFPFMQVHKVFARKNAIWPFTVVGRPPQEDTAFGNLIHLLTGSALQAEIPGLRQIHAVDAAGVHPLLLATGSERYTPYLPVKQPAEILTIANRILGTGQLSLAKFLFVTADDENRISPYHIQEFLAFVLQRIDFARDVHFYTNTTIDTLDYSGTGLNTGSKVVFAAYGDVKRQLAAGLPDFFSDIYLCQHAKLAMPGVVCMQIGLFTTYQTAQHEIAALEGRLLPWKNGLGGIALIILCDDANFTAQTLNNFLWVAFTRSNPAHDIYGIASFTEFKHWGCAGPVIIDARIKPHHAPPLEKDPAVERKIDRLFNKGGSLFGILK
jgi:4-hydroxy-3-polyprenylbenzoate decarboxylase